jgi:hypothetical protein
VKPVISGTHGVLLSKAVHALIILYNLRKRKHLVAKADIVGDFHLYSDIPVAVAEVAAASADQICVAEHSRTARKIELGRLRSFRIPL